MKHDPENPNNGPIYGVPLLDSLPIGSGGMRQALPSRRDLEYTAKYSQRTAAGYEVVLGTYIEVLADRDRWKDVAGKLVEACRQTVYALNPRDSFNPVATRMAYDDARAALAEYDKAKGETQP